MAKFNKTSSISQKRGGFCLFLKRANDFDPATELELRGFYFEPPLPNSVTLNALPRTQVTKNKIL